MRSTQQTINALINILSELGLSPDQLKPNSFLYKDLQLDSTEIVEVSLALKRRFGVRVKLEARQDRTLTDVCNLIDLAMSKDVD